MNADQLQWKWLQFKGDLQKQWSKFTDTDLREIGGNYAKFVGKVPERYAAKKRELLKWANHWHKKPAPDAAGKNAGKK
jgi:uncharacterized protein YjbJ (UPF0337 family)